MKLEQGGANARFHEADSQWLRSFSCENVRRNYSNSNSIARSSRSWF